MDRNQKIGLIAAVVAFGYQVRKTNRMNKRMERVARVTDGLVQIEVDKRFDDIVKNFGRY